MKINGYGMVLGLTSIIWSILRIIYKGNLVIYSSFAAISMIMVLVSSLAIISRSKCVNWRQFVIAGIFSSIAILSDPLSVYAVLVAIFFVMVTSPRRGLITLSTISLIAISFFTFLLVTNSLLPFSTDVLVFNSQIYDKYTDANPIRIREFFYQLITGLEIIDRSWLNPDLSKPVTLYYTEFDQWIFTGFLYRLAVILTCIYFFVKSSYKSGIFIYLFSAAILVINRWGFRAQPFILLSIFFISSIITNNFKTENHRPSRLFSHLSRIIIGLMTFWLVFQTGRFLATNWKMILPSTNFIGVREEARRINELVCGQENVLLADYPGGTYSYWFTGMKPLSKYIFMWPWVAEVGLNDDINSLDRKQVLALVRIDDAVIWEKYRTEVYLEPLDHYLKSNYIKVGEGEFISPELAAKCYSSDR